MLWNSEDRPALGGNLMKSASLLMLVLIVATLPSGTASACANKYLVKRSSHRPLAFHEAPRRARIVILRNPSSPIAEELASNAYRTSLTQVGHRVQVCDTVGDCERIAQQGGVDIVLADLTDAPRVRTALRNNAPHLRIIPMIYKGSRAQVDAARASYSGVYNGPTRPSTLLTLIDRMMIVER
jgi:hypothetical protein